MIARDIRIDESFDVPFLEQSYNIIYFILMLLFSIVYFHRQRHFHRYSVSLSSSLSLLLIVIVLMPNILF